MTTKFIIDIRKISKTDEIFKRLPNNKIDNDKASIGKKRGVGFAGEGVFTPCQLLYSSEDGNYSFKGLIEGTEGPRIQDGDYNHCDQVNTITGLREVGTASDPLYMTLKPDGVFLPSLALSGYFYTSNLLVFLYGNDSTVRLFYTSIEEVLVALQEYARSTGNDWANTALDISDLETVTITPAEIGTYNWDTEHPFYMIQDYTYVLTPPFLWNPFIDFIYGVPTSYDSTIDSQTSGLPLQIYDFPGVPITTSTDNPWTINGSPSCDQYDSLPVMGEDIFQLGIDSTTRLWEPNPDEDTAPLKYQNGVSIVNFEFDAPDYNRTGRVVPGKDGGFVIFETDTGTPINNAYVYRQNRTLVTIIPVSQMDAFLA